MRVLFDYQAFEFQRIGGVSRSYAELLSHLKGIAGCQCVLGLKESNNVYLNECSIAKGVKPLHYLHNRLFEGRKIIRGQRTAARTILGLLGYSNDGLNINQEHCIRLLRRQSFDIFEPTFFDSYFLPYLKGKPFVLTVHDMIPELYPQFFARDDYQIRMKRQLCPLASHIHVPSKKTKEDLINILGVNPDRVTVIYHGAPTLSRNADAEEKLFDYPYLLYVGDRYGYKNFKPWLIETGRIIRENKDVHIVCTGKPFNDSEKRLIQELHLENSIVHCFANSDALRNLYQNAIAFVYPSEYEGFGLPTLEAFVYGCPVMLNNASCFPEVGGDAAIYFKITGGSSDFYDKFQYLYNMSSEDRTALIEKGKQRAQLFSWDASAQQLFRVYHSLL